MIIFETASPKTLLAKIKDAIAAGHVTTWSCDADGDFTHTPPQWRAKAWLRPIVVPGKALKLNIIFAVSTENRREVYAVYHGRMLEMMLAHFDSNFDTSTASALLTAAEAA